MADQYGPYRQNPTSENPQGLQPGARCNSGVPAPYTNGRQQAPAPQQPPAAFVAPPGPPSARPPNAPRSGTRRRLIALGLGAVPVIAAGGYLATRLAHNGVASVGGSDGFNPANENSSTLPSAAANPDAISDAEVQALIAAANKALNARDEDGFAALFAPGPTATQARTTFRNLGKLPFTYLAFEDIGSDTRDFSTGTSATQGMNIALVHQIQHADVGQVAQWYRWTLTRNGSGMPVITGVTGAPSIDASDKYLAYPGPWDSANEIEVMTAGQAVLCAETAADAALMRKHASELAAAVEDNVSTWLGNGGTTGIATGALFMFTSAAKLNLWFGGAANQISNEAGLATPLIDANWLRDPDSSPITYKGARIALNTQSEFFTDNQGEVTVYCLAKHEATHAMLFPIMTAGQESVPYYDVEGFADFFATRGYRNPIAAYFRDSDILTYALGADGPQWGRNLPSNAEVYSVDGTVCSASYGLSAMVFYFTASQFGLPAAIKLVQSNYMAPADGSIPGQDDPSAAIEAATGLSTGQFTAGYLGFLHSNLGVAA